jgi:hypothetical protein
MKTKEKKAIKKLKLNKETVSILTEKMKTNLIGGGRTGQGTVHASQIVLEGTGC